MIKISVSQVDTSLHQLAAEHNQAGRLDQAQAAYHQILQSNSEDPKAHYGLGLLALMAGEPSKALSFIGLAVAATPNNGEIRVHLGIAHSLASTRSRRPIFLPSTRDHRLAIG